MYDRLIYVKVRYGLLIVLDYFFIGDIYRTIYCFLFIVSIYIVSVPNILGRTIRYRVLF